MLTALLLCIVPMNPLLSVEEIPNPILDIINHRPYFRSLSKIGWEPEEKWALIELTDGSIWKWVPDIYSEHFLRKWKSDNEILVRIDNEGGFILHNFSHPRYSPHVALMAEAHTTLPKIVEIIPEEQALRLSDGSAWEVLFDFQNTILSKWEVGDVIVPTQNLSRDYELINVDMPFFNRGYDDYRRINAKMLRYPQRAEPQEEELEEPDKS